MLNRLFTQHDVFHLNCKASLKHSWRNGRKSADNQGYGTDGMGKCIGNSDEVKSVIEDMFRFRIAQCRYNVRTLCYTDNWGGDICKAAQIKVSTHDATSGFMQIALDEESSYLTRFATPFHME